jgi:IQ domain-containing protein H
MTSTHDQIFSVDPERPYVFCGASFPQRSVPHAAIRGAALALGAAMYERGIIGHVGIDFVSFYDEFNRRQRLWAVDLNIGMTRSAVAFTMCDFLLRGKVETASGEYTVSPMAMDELPSAITGGGPEAGASLSGSSAGGGGSSSSSGTSSVASSATALTAAGAASEPRSYVAVDCLYHPNLGAMQYGAFFNLCRLHGVSFDLQQRSGTAFMLSDSLAAGILGLIGVGASSEAAFKTVAKAMKFIESQVGTLRAQGEFDTEKSNFSDVSAAIKARVAAFGGVPEGKRGGGGGRHK